MRSLEAIGIHDVGRIAGDGGTRGIVFAVIVGVDIVADEVGDFGRVVIADEAFDEFRRVIEARGESAVLSIGFRL